MKDVAWTLLAMLVLCEILAGWAKKFGVSNSGLAATSNPVSQVLW